MNFILHVAASVAAALLLAGNASALNPEAVSKPNIILAMADDMGWGDPGFNGNKVIKTPNLDQMAAAGLRFERFYSGAPVCSPTRGSCLTGRHPYRYGIWFANAGHIRKEEITLAEALKTQGYATGHFGKWHLGTLDPAHSGKAGRNPGRNFMTPGMSGFDEWLSTEYAVRTWNPGKDNTVNPYYHNGKIETASRASEAWPARTTRCLSRRTRMTCTLPPGLRRRKRAAPTRRAAGPRVEAPEAVAKRSRPQEEWRGRSCFKTTIREPSASQ